MRNTYLILYSQISTLGIQTPARRQSHGWKLSISVDLGLKVFRVMPELALIIFCDDK